MNAIPAEVILALSMSANGPNDSRPGAARPATNVLLAPNSRDTSPVDCSERTWPVREIGSDRRLSAYKQTGNDAPGVARVHLWVMMAPRVVPH